MLFALESTDQKDTTERRGLGTGGCAGMGAGAVVTKIGKYVFPIKRKQFVGLAENIFPHQCKDG